MRSFSILYFSCTNPCTTTRTFFYGKFVNFVFCFFAAHVMLCPDFPTIHGIYPKKNYRYYYYHPEDQKVFVAKRAVFLEKQYILGGDSGSMIELSKVGKLS
ncbi:unnamed protein product [Musa textilis]